MKYAWKTLFHAALAVCAVASMPSHAAANVDGWLHWRGPNQNGTSDETGLPETVGEDNLLWTYDIAGRGEAVIADGKVYSFGYRGVGPELREYLSCLNAETGKLQWEIGFNDFISDVVVQPIRHRRPHRRSRDGQHLPDDRARNLRLCLAGG